MSTSPLTFPTIEAASWAINQSGHGGIDSLLSVAEEDGVFAVSGPADAIAAVAAVPAVDAPASISARLSSLKAARKSAIDASAEVERGKYITLGAGQAMTYQRKTEEARLYVQAVAAEQEIDPADFPLLQATVGIDGATIGAVAELVLQMDAQWAVIGAAIEAARLGAKAAIDVAEDEAAVLAVQPAWPAPG